MNFIETMANLWKSTGIAHSIAYGEWQNYVMILVSFVLFYLAIVKQFEPLLLLPISFGMFIIKHSGRERRAFRHRTRGKCGQVSRNGGAR